MPGVADTGVIDYREAAILFSRHLTGTGGLVLAVSGGSDSMALMHLVARWISGVDAQLRPDIDVVTVDHGLRPGSAAEAGFVVREAVRAGLTAQKLRWDGPYPETGIPAAAREARYKLMSEVCRRLEAVLVTAHTLDDQAETLIMALARGAGVDGLSAMQPVSEFKGMTIVRPLLETSRSRLRATLLQAGVGWVEDPTNADATFERVRVRQALTTLESEGVSRVDLVRSSRRLGRARRALNHTAGVLARDSVVHEGCGFARVQLDRFFQAPDEIQLRCLLQVARAYGGGMVQSLAGAEDLLHWMQSGTGKARTFAGCRIARRSAEFVVGRESDRVDEAPVRLQPGQCIAAWDQRYKVSTDRASGPVELRVLRDVSHNLLAKRPATVPDFVWQGLPVAIDLENRVILPSDADRFGASGQQFVVFDLLGAPKTDQSR